MKVKLVLDQECRGFGGDREVMQAQNLLSHLLMANDNGMYFLNTYVTVTSYLGKISTGKVEND